MWEVFHIDVRCSTQCIEHCLQPAKSTLCTHACLTESFQSSATMGWTLHLHILSSNKELISMSDPQVGRLG